MGNSLPHKTASHLIGGLKKVLKRITTFLSLSVPTYKKESLDWVTSFLTGFHRALGCYGDIARAAAGVRKVMRAQRKAQADMGSEVPWRAEPPFWSQSLIPLGDTKRSPGERLS